MKPIEIACRTCAQQPGEKCGKLVPVGWTNLYFFHAARIEDAKAMSAPPATEKEIEIVSEAVETVAEGLV